MLVQILILIAGLVLIVGGANDLVEGSSSIARKLGISEFVIGLTVIGMGTSAPEMVVSFIGAAGGNSDISVGNVIGSNIMNTLLIAGLTALILPIGISRENKRTDIPFSIFIVVLLFVLGMNRSLFGLGSDRISRTDGVLLLVLFAAYMAYSFIKGKDMPQENENVRSCGTARSVIKVTLGLACLIFGGRIFVNSATAIARMAGVSDRFIALTILAGGTSMPELATCVVAAVKKRGALALGNVIGSNIFNILFILGGSALIHPLSMDSMDMVDFAVLALSAVLLLISAFTGRNDRIGRAGGTVFLLCMAAYMGWLIYGI